MLARTCNQKPCELAQFETTVRMVLPAARTSCGACHVRCRHDVEPEKRFEPNRNLHRAFAAVRNRSLPYALLRPVQKMASQGFGRGVSSGQPFRAKFAHIVRAAFLGGTYPLRAIRSMQHTAAGTGGLAVPAS